MDFSRNNTAGFAVPLSLTLKKITAQFSSLRRELIQQATQRADSRLLKAILEPTVIDIGAASYGPISSHDGSDALLLLMQLHDVHGAQVHGFEIQPRKAQALVEEAKRLRRRMQPRTKGISKPGQLTGYLHRQSPVVVQPVVGRKQ